MGYDFKKGDEIYKIMSYCVCKCEYLGPVKDFPELYGPGGKIRNSYPWDDSELPMGRVVEMYYLAELTKANEYITREYRDPERLVELQGVKTYVKRKRKKGMKAFRAAIIEIFNIEFDD